MIHYELYIGKKVTLLKCKKLTSATTSNTSVLYTALRPLFKKRLNIP